MGKHFIFLLIIMGVFFAYLRYFEHKSLYFPTKEIEIMPDAIGLRYEDVYALTKDGVRIHGWFVPAKDSTYTVLFCHGNGGNISHRIEKISIFNGLGLNVFIFDYRGYGMSTGRPSEQGFYKDAKASYDYLILEKKVLPEGIVIYGESLGGAVAIDLAARIKAKALILESTFSSSKDVARLFYPLFPTFLIHSKFDSGKKIKEIRIPKLIIHSKNDDIIPFSQSLELFNASPEPKRHVVLIGSHNNCFLDSRNLYEAGIRDFLNGLIRY